MAVEMIPLKAVRIGLSHSTDLLVELVKSSDESVFYTCRAVSKLGISQGAAFQTLVNLTHAQLLRCSLAADLWSIKHRLTKDLPQVDPLKYEEQELIFYRPGFENSPSRLFAQEAVEQIWDLEDNVIKKKFPNYRVGPPLKFQEGSDLIRRRLRRGIQLLERSGLIRLATPIDKGFRPYSHSSLFLLTSESLGLPTVPYISDFQDNPTAFMAMASVNALIPLESQQQRDFVLLEQALRDTSKLEELEADDQEVDWSSIPRVRFPEDIAWHILQRLNEPKDSNWWTDFLGRMQNPELRRLKPLPPAFDLDKYDGMSQYQKIAYVSEFVNLSNANIGKIVGEKPDVVQAVLAGNIQPSKGTQENLYWLLMLFSGFLRLSQYNTRILAQLLADTDYFTTCSVPPPWYPDTLRDYITSGSAMLKKAVKWLKN